MNNKFGGSLIVVFIFSFCARNAMADISDQSSSFVALEYLNNNAESIIQNAEVHEENSPPILRNNGSKFPVLSSIGNIELDMTEEGVQKLMGTPSKISETNDGWKWHYIKNEDADDTVIIAFSLQGQVKQIFSSSNKHTIPVNLGVRNLLSEFEASYGSRRFRKTTSLTPVLNIVKYPFSNLVLVVDRNTQEVYSLMVYKT